MLVHTHFGKVSKANSSYRRPPRLSFVPEAGLLLRHVVREQMALPAGLDTASVGHGGVPRLTLALTVLKAAGVPPYAQF